MAQGAQAWWRAGMPAACCARSHTSPRRAGGGFVASCAPEEQWGRVSCQIPPFQGFNCALPRS